MSEILEVINYYVDNFILAIIPFSLFVLFLVLFIYLPNKDNYYDYWDKYNGLK